MAVFFCEQVQFDQMWGVFFGENEYRNGASGVCWMHLNPESGHRT